MPPINASVTNQQITASVGETQIDVSVSGGVGPTGPQGAPGATDYTQLTNVPASFPPSAHGHTIAEVSGLSVALDGKQAAGSYAASVHTHTAAQITDFTAAVVAAAPPTTNASLLTSGTLDAARLPGSVVLTTDARLTDARTPTDGSVTTAKIASGAVTSDKIAAGQSVSFSSLAVAGAISTSGIGGAISASGAISSAAAITAPSVISTAAGLIADLGSGIVVRPNSISAAVFNVSGAGVVTAGAWQGTAVAVAYGGTGATTASAARTNLGLAIGADVAAAAHQHTASQISDFTAAVIAAAPPTVDASLLSQGTLPDARLSSNIARTSDITTAVANVVNAAPAASVSYTHLTLPTTSRV